MCLAVFSHNTGPVNGEDDREVLDTDIMEYLVESAEAHMEATYYAGEAIPVFRPDLGADVFAACLGAPLEYTEHTTWAKETIADWEEAPSFEIDEDSFTWKWHHDVYRMAAERAAGRYFVAAPDCQRPISSKAAIAGTAGRFDVLASLPIHMFPGGTLFRYPGMVLGMLYYSLKDRLG